MELLINEKRLIAPKEVFFEITEQDDNLSSWAKKHKIIFRDPTESQIKLVKDLLEKFPALVKEDRKYDADVWVIALALEMDENSKGTLFPNKHIIVTDNSYRRKIDRG